MKGRVGRLKILNIRLMPEAQARLAIDEQIVVDYAALMEGGTIFPPVTVWFDGETYWLSDGFHRIMAAQRCGLLEIDVEIFTGGLEDATWHSYTANARHGLRRTRADIQALIAKALGHPRATRLSTMQIAKHLGLPESTVRRARRRLTSPNDEDGERLALRNGKHYRIKTDLIGKAVGNSQRRKTLREIDAGLADMRALGSERAQRLLNIIHNWISGSTTSSDCLQAIERLLASLAANNAGREGGTRAVATRDQATAAPA